MVKSPQNHLIPLPVSPSTLPAPYVPHHIFMINSPALSLSIL